jgi:hypothetical protein
MKKIIGGLVLATLMGGCGCMVAPFQPPMGIVSVVKAPLSTEGNFNAGSKSGEASVVSILGIVSTGDCSIDAAVKDGGLSKVNHLDYDYLNILGIYQKATVIAYGE